MSSKQAGRCRCRSRGAGPRRLIRCGHHVSTRIQFRVPHPLPVIASPSGDIPTRSPRREQRRLGERCAIRGRHGDLCEVRVIRKRAGGYGVAVYDSVAKRKRWVGTFSTLREAREAERLAAASPAARGNDSCAAVAERWLTDNARPAPASQRTYRYALQGFSRDFARVRLRDVDKLTARAWARTQAQSNVRVVRALFTDAINDGLHPGPNPLRKRSPRTAAGPKGPGRAHRGPGDGSRGRCPWLPW
jgi:hypothetical protein